MGLTPIGHWHDKHWHTLLCMSGVSFPVSGRYELLQLRLWDLSSRQQLAQDSNSS